MQFKRIEKAAKYLQIKAEIAARIARGTLAPGAQLPPERKLMQDFGVSYSTMARALAELTRDGLVERRWGQGTFVRDVKTLPTNVAVMFGDVYSATHPYIDRLLKGITQSARDLDWHIQIFPLRDGVVFGGHAETLLARMVRDGLVRGVIGCGVQPPDDLRQLAEAEVALVTINTIYPEANVPSVVSDAADAARQIVDHLLALGHRRIALLSGPQPRPEDRVLRASAPFPDAAIQALAAKGLEMPTDNVIHTDYQWAACRDAVRALLTGPLRPTAVMCIDDLLALEVVRLAEALAMEIPRDLSVVSSGDILPQTMLTSVTMPLEEMGRRAVQMLDHILRGEPQEACCLKGMLTVRGTSGPAPALADTDGRAGQAV